MHVLYFSESYCGHDHRFLTSIASAGHEVTFVRLYDTLVDLSPLNGIAGIHFADIKGIDKNFDPLSYIRFGWEFRKAVWNLTPDVIHAGPVDKCGAIAAFSGYHPFVIMSWGYDLMKTAQESLVWNLFARYALRSADQFTSDALPTRDKAISLGMSINKCTTFPWGVDLTHFHPGDRAPGSGNEIVLFCNRSWEKNYGVDVLAKAFSRIANKYPNLRLHLLGSGSMENELRTILENAGISNQVNFPGRIPQNLLPNYYQKADVYITPSRVDGTSVSLMEAMACGLPVIASDIPGNADWVQEGQQGWLFKDGDDADLAEKIELAIEHKSILTKLGLASRTVAEKRANWTENVKVLFETYERAQQESYRNAG